MFTPIFPHRKVFTKELGKPVFVHWPEQLPHQPKNDALSFLCSKLVGCIFHVFSPCFIFWGCFGDFPIHHGLRIFDRQFWVWLKTNETHLSKCISLHVSTELHRQLTKINSNKNIPSSFGRFPKLVPSIYLQNHLNEASTFTP